MKDRLVTIKDAARILDRHPQTLRAWDKKGILTPTQRIRGTRYYSIKQLESMLSGEKKER